MFIFKSLTDYVIYGEVIYKLSWQLAEMDKILSPGSLQLVISIVINILKSVNGLFTF